MENIYLYGPTSRKTLAQSCVKKLLWWNHMLQLCSQWSTLEYPSLQRIRIESSFKILYTIFLSKSEVNMTLFQSNIKNFECNKNWAFCWVCHVPLIWALYIHLLGLLDEKRSSRRAVNIKWNCLIPSTPNCFVLFCCFFTFLVLSTVHIKQLCYIYCLMLAFWPIDIHQILYLPNYSPVCTSIYYP